MYGSIWLLHLNLTFTPVWNKLSIQICEFSILQFTICKVLMLLLFLKKRVFCYYLLLHVFPCVVQPTTSWPVIYYCWKVWRDFARLPILTEMKSTSKEPKNIRVSCQDTFHCLPAVLANLGDPSWLEVSKCDAHVPERLEGGSGGSSSLTSGLGKVMEIIQSAITSMHSTTRRPGLARVGLGKADPAWPTWCLSIAR